MKIRSTLHIDAPQSVVWSVTEDVDRWPDWAPAMTSVKRLDVGPFDVGSTALIKQTGLPAAKWTVTAMTPGEAFTWNSRVRGIDMIATHQLDNIETGTRSVLMIELSGAMAVLFWPLLRFALQWALDRENKGLKTKCEEIAARLP